MMLFCTELKIMPQADSYENTIDLVENNDEINKLPQELQWSDVVFDVMDVIAYSRRTTKGIGCNRTIISHRYIGDFTINIKFDDFNLWYKMYMGKPFITSKDLLHQISQI